ncbi:uncharacterized protein PV07_07936 [Cladophialophora immunda]|uniref:Uncharacterized protein n=1 Tax=Cladophialophora immunda TaxID=569365 RepID=A0A0D2ASW3_9EURO|nr:uncharacterized protein PV07_07936 [Cladophialophora immunda]KIW28257.1 hypothetical protein PV07_07936 [Cladophialophora immunda]OQV08003.1 hypothetical protein CLAIMM_12342 isoform 1 [Cladophialophora immunda]
MAFPILTTEDLGALSVVRREQLFQYKVDTFSRLPDEILLLILSQVITGCISLYQGGSRHLLRSAAYVRRVCRRFRALADQLMFNTPLQQILLIGPIFGDFRQMTSIYEEYRNILWTRLSRGSPGHISLRTTVHFLPCLDTSDSVNWFRDNSLAEELNDELAPQRAITGHYAAALVLSRILQEVIDRQYGKDGKKSLFLVFHEIDMTYFRGDQYFQERHCHPEFMPFWDSKGMQLILREWGWIFQPPCKKNYHHIQIILPNVAWATSANPRNELEAGNLCVADLRRAFEQENDSIWGEMGLLLPPENQFQRENMIWLPGFSFPVVIPKDSLYAKWLGPLAQEAAEIFCFTVRGLTVGVDIDGEISVLKRTWQPPSEPVESSSDPDTDVANTEKARQHQAVSLKRSERIPALGN